MGNWYRFSSQSSFDSWHQTVKNKLGIPYPNRNLKSGEIDTDAQWTTSFIEPLFLQEDDLRIFLTDEYAETYSEDLGELSTPPYNSKLKLEM